MKHNAFFKLTETQCKCGCGGGTKLGDMDDRIMLVAAAVRLKFNKPVVITSAFRCHKHNTNVGGATRSRHLPRDKKGNIDPQGAADALDIKVTGVDPKVVQEFIKATFPGVSIGLGKGFTHIDYRPLPRVIFSY